MTDSQPEITEFIPIAEAARRIGVSRDCLYRAIKAGEVPGGRCFGGRRVIARAPFEAWLTGTAEPARPMIDFVQRRKAS